MYKTQEFNFFNHPVRVKKGVSQYFFSPPYE